MKFEKVAIVICLGFCVLAWPVYSCVDNERAAQEYVQLKYQYSDAAFQASKHRALEPTWCEIGSDEYQIWWREQNNLDSAESATKSRLDNLVGKYPNLEGQ